MASDDESEDSLKPEINPEEYIFAFYITDELRQIFLLVSLVLNFISVNIGVIFMCLAWFVRNSLAKQISFLQDFYQPNAIPVMVGASGFIMVGASIVGIKAAIDGRMLQDEEADMKSIAKIFFIYSVAASIAYCAVFIAGLTCFIEIAVLSSALGDGLLAGMEKYMTNAEIKPEIDIMQMDYKCCGSKNYKDWYEIPWQDAKYLETQDAFIQSSLKKGKYVGKDVPFSCCKWTVMRPCVDTRIEDASYHSKYTYPDDLTLYTTGCLEAVSGYLGHTVFKSVGLFVFFCSLSWLVLAVTGRYLSTSINHMSVGEPPIGWLVPYIKPTTGIFSQKLEKRVEESDED